MKRFNVIFSLAVLVLSVLCASALAAEPQIRRDFEINDMEVLGEAHKKFLEYPDKSVIEDYKAFLKKTRGSITQPRSGASSATRLCS